MVERLVTQSSKDDDGDITGLCNPKSSWSSVSKEQAICHIESGEHSYFVDCSLGRVEITVVDGKNGKYLRTKSDGTEGNNLDELPNCTCKDTVTIYVEGTPHEVAKGDITFTQVVQLEVPSYQGQSGITYAVRYKRGHGSKPEGILSPGASVKAKEGMRFNVSETGQS